MKIRFTSSTGHKLRRFITVVSCGHSGFLHHQSLKNSLLARKLGVQREDLDPGDERKRAEKECEIQMKKK
jgi:hypothetical protein